MPPRPTEAGPCRVMPAGAFRVRVASPVAVTSSRLPSPLRSAPTIARDEVPAASVAPALDSLLMDVPSATSRSGPRVHAGRGLAVWRVVEAVKLTTIGSGAARASAA